jgi:cell filamentation protein
MSRPEAGEFTTRPAALAPVFEFITIERPTPTPAAETAGPAHDHQHELSYDQRPEPVAYQQHPEPILYNQLPDTPHHYRDNGPELPGHHRGLER